MCMTEIAYCTLSSEPAAELCASVFTILILGIVFGLIAHNQKTALQELSVGYNVTPLEKTLRIWKGD